MEPEKQIRQHGKENKQMEEMLYQPPILIDKKYRCSFRSGSYHTSGHWHNEIELLYCIKGSVTAIVGGQKVTVMPGELCILNSTEEHALFIEEKDSAVLMMEFGQALFGNEFDAFASHFFVQRIVNLQPKPNEEAFATQLRTIFSDIPNENQKTPSDSQWLMCGYLYLTVALLYRSIPRCKTRSASRDLKIKHINVIAPILTYVDNYYHTSINLKTVADMVGYERKSFCKIFKATVGRSFHSYLNEYRIRQAKLMLLNSDKKISDIGAACGIAIPRAFSRVFAAYTGTTPNEYRKSHRLEETLSSINS